ncbi:MAG TPA: hypothetical protein VK589_10700 [Chryseolinea sp.]|nr:hypothetical protein [Chryseolinea sp.]
MKKISKKEIRNFIEGAIKKVDHRFETAVTSKKGEKLLDSFSRKYAAEIKKALKKSGIEPQKEQPPKIARKQTKKIK